MPTSEFLELVSIPTASLRSIKSVLVAGLAARARAMDSPTAPPPITLYKVNFLARCLHAKSYLQHE